MTMGTGTRSEDPGTKSPWWRWRIERSPRGRLVLICLLFGFLISFAWLFLASNSVPGGASGSGKGSAMTTTNWSIGLDFGLSSLFPSWGIDRAARAQADVKVISTQLKTYEMTMLTPPSHANGLKALVTRPTSGPNITRWRQLLQSIPLDPWGNPYAYTFPAKRSTDAYDIYSRGPDRRDGTKDDIGNW